MRTVLLLCLGFFLSGINAYAADDIVKVHEGTHFIWYARDGLAREQKAAWEPFFGYADKAIEAIENSWNLTLPEGKFALWVHEMKGQGKDGFAAGDIGEVHDASGSLAPGIGIIFDAFTNKVYDIDGYWGYVLITHETVNLLTGQMVSGGWPLDWWADHKSPFPAMTAVDVERKLVPAVYVHHDAQFENDTLYQMFKDLKDYYGWRMFHRTFDVLKADRIDLSALGPNPGSTLTNYVCAYLEIGAEEPLTDYFKRGGVPDFDRKAVDAIKARRESIMDLDRSAPEWDTFRNGEYN
jgi:hypothetical protein